MIVKARGKKTRITLPSKRPFGTFYEIGKQSLQYYGYYEDLKRYDPGYYIEKYTYKPHKRIAGYLGQKFHAKKRKLSSSYYKLDQECLQFWWWSQFHDNNKCFR